MLIYCCLSERNIAFNANDKGILFASVIGGEGSENIEFVCLRRWRQWRHRSELFSPGLKCQSWRGRRKKEIFADGEGDFLTQWWNYLSFDSRLNVKVEQEFRALKMSKLKAFEQVVGFIRKFLEETSGQDGRLRRFFTSDNLKYQI